MAERSTYSPAELAHRSSEGLDVTLVCVRGDGEDRAVACVCDTRDGAHVEIPTEPYLDLDVDSHPFAHRDPGSVDSDDSRLPG